MATAETFEFQVRRDDLSATRFVEASTRPDQPVAAGDALLRVDRFALTANNITYGLLGTLMKYWNFFPAPEGWGRIPVWGFADVVQSRAEGVREGERVFGYFPISSYLRVTPTRATDQAFLDASEHRRELPAVYQQYVRATGSDRRQEDLRAILAPLSGTGFLIDDWLTREAWFGARQIVFASASSKTALGTAFLLSRRPERAYQVIGLTAARNRAFCERVGYYDRVVEYAELASLPATTPTLFIDMASNAGVLAGVHQHFGDALRYSCIVGMTHQPDFSNPPQGLPGPVPQFFSAPAQIGNLRNALGFETYLARSTAAQHAFAESASAWLEIVHGSGRAAIDATYAQMLQGLSRPEQGLILSPH